MFSANTDNWQKYQQYRWMVRGGKEKSSTSRYIKELSDGAHVHCLGPQPVGGLRRLFDNFQSYILKHRIYDQHSVPAGTAHESGATHSLKRKYGNCENIIHYGCSTSVRLHCQKTKDTREKQLYAVKVFHHYSERNISNAFRLALRRASNLKHPNIVRILELLDDDRGELCIVMEHCGAGDLHSMMVRLGMLGEIEADCFFKQLMRAISYIHDNGIAHQNLNPKSVLLTIHGAVKVTHFTWAQESLEKQADRPLISSESTPYQPPEAIFAATSTSDARAGDIWAAALIYMTMRIGHNLWSIASDEDREFQTYLCTRTDEDGYFPIQTLSNVSVIPSYIWMVMK